MTEQRIKWEDAVQRLIDDPTQAELVKACYFDPPLVQAARRYHQSAEWQQVRTLLPPAPAVIVDIGAGNGIVSYALAQDGYTCIAIEPDPSTLVGAGAADNGGFGHRGRRRAITEHPATRFVTPLPLRLSGHGQRQQGSAYDRRTQCVGVWDHFHKQ